MVDTSEGKDVVSASAIVASVTSSVLAEATGFRGHRTTIAAGSLSSTGPEHAVWIRTYLIANPSRAISGNFAPVPAGVTYEDVSIEREKFDVTFECHHCHHKWTETVFKVEKVK